MNTSGPAGPLVALAPFLAACPRVITLGIRSSLAEYTPQEKMLLLSASLVLFPTRRLAGILEAAGKQTFPSPLSYKVRKSRLAQETLFQVSGCAHPRTRIYYGRQKEFVPEKFNFPLLAMGPRMQDGAFLLPEIKDLRALSEKFNPLIIQEHLKLTERVLLVFVNFECIGAVDDPASGAGLLRRPQLSSGRRVSSGFACEVAQLVRSFGLNDIGVEVGFSKERGWQITRLLRPPVLLPSPNGLVNRHEHIAGLVCSGKLPL